MASKGSEFSQSVQLLFKQWYEIVERSVRTPTPAYPSPAHPSAPDGRRQVAQPDHAAREQASRARAGPRAPKPGQLPEGPVRCKWIFLGFLAKVARTWNFGHGRELLRLSVVASLQMEVFALHKCPLCGSAQCQNDQLCASTPGEPCPAKRGQEAVGLERAFSVR